MNSNARALFKSAMARVSSQAMILTSGTTTAKPSLHGMTLSSVSSLSAYPLPMLMFNLHLPSYTSAALHQNDGALAIHVMPPTKTAVYLGRKFAGGIKRDNSHFDSISDDDPYHEMTMPFVGLDHSYYMHLPRHGVAIPVLKDLEVVFICRRHDVFLVEDHEIWVVKVDEILHPGSERSAPSGGLLYFQKGFHQVGKPLSE